MIICVLSYIFVLLLLPTNLSAQGMQTWEQMQQEGSHLQASKYRVQRCYRQGEKGAARQGVFIKYYDMRGYMERELYFKNGLDTLYDLRFKPSKDYSRILIRNEQEEIKSAYQFDSLGRLQYYLDDLENTSAYRFYKYERDKKLALCKDCLYPFNKEHWCALYRYHYKENKLVEISSSSVGTFEHSDSAQVYARDSLFYDRKGRLIKRRVRSAKGELIQESLYLYRGSKLRSEDITGLHQDNLGKRTRIVYNYSFLTKRCRKKVRKEQKGGEVLSTKIEYYDRLGRIKKMIVKRQTKPRVVYTYKYR